MPDQYEESTCRTAEAKVSGRETVQRLGKIARLDLLDEELDQFSSDLEDILAHFSILDDAPGVEDYNFNPVEIKDALREDEPEVMVDPALLRSQMKTHDDWVRGPRLS